MDTIGDLYEAYLLNKHDFPDAPYFYGKIPRNYSEVVSEAINLPSKKVDPEKMVKLKEILLGYHKKLGILTPKVKEHIEHLDEGVVITGQQATIFGGSGIVGNKIVSAVNVSKISEQKNRKLVPVFLVNTHDGIQPEISTIHLPNNQSSASKPLNLDNITEGIVSKTILTDDFNWIEENLAIIKNIFSEFKSSIDKSSNKLFAENVEHIITFLRETYRASTNIGDWVTLIWGIQANILNDWGVVFLPSSHEEIRKLTLEGYLPFLENRQKYIDEFNSATEKIRELGLNPTTARKKNDYSPFFYECPNDGYRITLSCQENEENLTFTGECPIEKRNYSFTLKKDEFNLTSLSNILLPRLDTNHALLETILPVYVRISGPGEINYNAQVIPATRQIGLQFPIYVKYTRMLYNTPWIEKLTKESLNEAQSLFSQEFFQTLGSIAKARRKRDKEQLFEFSIRLCDIIISKMLHAKQINGKATEDFEKYKSWQFGMYDSNHQWQEVSFPWFIMASITGLTDYLNSYKRYYSADSPVGGIGYINSRL